MSASHFAREIKARVDTKDLFTYYGFKPNRSGFICCPFHGEKTPSLKVYNGDGGFHCFGCGAHGSVIDFVEKYFSLSFTEAMAKINADFGLCLPIGEQLDRRKQMEMAKAAYERKKEQDKKAAHLKGLQDKLFEAHDLFVKSFRALQAFKPTTDAERLDPVFVKALNDFEYAKYLLTYVTGEIRDYEQGLD